MIDHYNRLPFSLFYIFAEVISYLKRVSRALKKRWSDCIGQPEEFPIESRIFHAVVIAASLFMMLNGFIAIAMEFGMLTLFTFSFMPVFWLMYYLSRYKWKYNLSVFIFGITANFDNITAFFYCGGSEGVNLMLLLAITFILAVVSPKEHVKYWVILNSVILIALLAIEYYYPHLISPMYTSRGERLIDQGQSWLMLFVFTTIITRYIKANYFTEKKKADLRELELIKMNETKDKLFSIVAHDLRAPLGSVQNYLELLKQVYLTEEEKVMIQNQLLNSTKSTSEMLTNILSWTKAQMAGVSMNFIHFNMHKTLQNTIQVQMNIAKEKGIELSFQEKCDMNVFADPDMMQLVVRNLLNNAIKFTPGGGKIWISYEEKDELCTIIVRDNGIGIAKAKQQEVFTLKSQSTFGTNNEKGVGLGLVLAKNYMELQNGKIWFESEEGIGTTFFLNFPSAVL